MVIETLVGTGRCGMARACRLFGLARSAVYRKPVARLRRRDGLLAFRGGGKRRRIQPRERVRRSATRCDEVWSYDFIQGSLADGRPVRILSIIDEYSRGCVMLRAARSLPARRVIDCLPELLVTTGCRLEWLRQRQRPGVRC